VLNERAYVFGDVFVRITGDEDYRELGVDSERILYKLRTRYEGHSEISDQKSDFGGIRSVVLQRLCGIGKRCVQASMALNQPFDHFFNQFVIIYNKNKILFIAESLYHRRSIPLSAEIGKGFLARALDIRLSVPILFFI
jgi:hypothetical protein